MAVLNRTPCVGICSTTYGDLVCRGCKRFAHEIVQWNGFAGDQRERVWQRLYALRDGAVAAQLKIEDIGKLRAAAARLKVGEADTLSEGNLAFEVLRRVARRAPALLALGLHDPQQRPALEVLEAIENDFYQRSLARYERDFHTLAT